jgi:AbrB family looped-hinge helix DNA binding protein
MTTTVEIDKAGRIVVPKKLRDALHLTPGTELKVERLGNTLVFEPNIAKAHLRIENGVPLIFAAEPQDFPALDNETVIKLIEQGRLERERRILSLDDDPKEIKAEATV